MAKHRRREASVQATNPEYTRITADEKMAEVRKIMWQLSMQGWRNDPELISLLPYAALYYAGELDDTWLTTLPKKTQNLILQYQQD